MNPELKVANYSHCKGDHEFYCWTCDKGLCVLCKEKHFIDLDFQHHDVVIDRFKSRNLMKPWSCDRHRYQYGYVNKWCLSCKFLVCAECEEHKNHELLDIFTAFKMFKDKYKDRISHIRTKIIFNNLAILTKIKSDVKTGGEICQSIIPGLQQSMTERSWKLIKMTDLVVNEISGSKLLKHFLKSRLEEQKRNIANTEMFLHKLLQLFDKPVQFLMCLKKTLIPKIKDIPDQFSFSLHSEINHSNLTKLFAEFQILEKGLKGQLRNELLLDLMHEPVLKKYFKVENTVEVVHISCVTTDLIWISDSSGRIILTTTTGAPVHIVTNALSDTGGHTVTREGNLIYIDINNNIKKLSTDNTIHNSLIENTNEWNPQCLCSSSSDGDLLVGVMRFNTFKRKQTFGKVLRYSSTGERIQVIERNKKGQKLYKRLKYITENHNGDIIVSDFKRGVVVTDRAGQHRFSYKRPPSGFRIYPHGVCVDGLSHILVCDAKSRTIQIIDKDGHFLSMFSEQIIPIDVSVGLAYDNQNHLLWFGTMHFYKFMLAYRYIQRKDFLTSNCND